MNYCLLPLLGALLLSGCDSTPKKPAEVVSPCLAQFHSYQGPIKYGYGEGANLHQAKQQAYRDIAEQLGVEVDSNNLSIQQKIDNQVSTQFRSEINTHTSAKLNDLRVACLKRHQGQLTVTLSYDIRPLHLQVAESFMEQWLGQPSELQLQGPAALTTSTLISDLKKEVLGSGPSQQLSFAIERNNGWRLRLNDKRWRLRNEQLQYVINWAALNKPGISLQSKDEQGRNVPQKIYAGTEFRLHTQTQQQGYLHVLGLYEDGTMDILRQDLISKNNLRIPDKGIFEAATLNGSNESTDVYIALLTEKNMQHYPALAQLLAGDIDGNDFNHLLATIEQSASAVKVLVMTVME